MTILEQELKIEIIQIQSNVSQGKSKLVLKEGILYLQYNKFGDYGYQLAFSEKENDRIRFDNYDKFWVVKTKPHHFHPRGEDKAYDSPMIGNPEKDMKILCELIKSKQFNQNDFRFIL